MKVDIHLFIILISILIRVSVSLYEDQINKWDFKQSYIGKPVEIFTQSKSRIGIISTELNVLSSIYLKNGSINWRHTLNDELDVISTSLNGNGDQLIVTCDRSGKFLRSWNPVNGLLNWETHLSILPEIEEIYKTLVHIKDPETLYIAQFYRYASEEKEVSLVSFQTKNFNSSEIMRFKLISDLIPSDCHLSGTHLICLDNGKGLFYHLNINKDDSFIMTPLYKLNIISDYYKLSKLSNEEFIGIDLGRNGHVIIQIVKEDLKVIKELRNVIKIQYLEFTSGSKYLFALYNKDESSRYKIVAFNMDFWTEESTLESRLHLPSDYLEIERIQYFPYANDQYKIMMSTNDGSVIFMNKDGTKFWIREESLASIISAEILDLPLSESDATIESTLGMDSSNILSQFSNRILSEVIQFKSHLSHIATSFTEFLNDPSFISSKNNIQDNDYVNTVMLKDDRDALIRDKFGMHKIIVIVTKQGKLFGMDTFTGKILWSLFDKRLGEQLVDAKELSIFIQRTTAHYPHPPYCTIITKEGYILSFNPIFGELYERLDMKIPIKQMLLLSTVDRGYLKSIIFMDMKNNLHVYPRKSTQFFIDEQKSIYFMVLAHENGQVEGYGFNSISLDNMKATKLWSINIPNYSVEFKKPKLELYFKKHNEHVHSQGRVLGDRSVLYKYLNPNLIAIVSQGFEKVSSNQDSSKLSSIISLYLLDGITGSIIYSTVHKRAKGPVHLIHSENSVVYSYYNERFRRTEISSIELYEGKSQVNATSFSSISRHFIKPAIVEHQTFIFPTGILTMTDTMTEKGITNKHILVSLPSGGILELPKAFLDPRRPIHPTIEHREEGLIPYVPELPIPSEGIINYNKSLIDVRKIITAPSNLESTSLVFVYGLDIYFTRVTPSKTFDILKDDFDHFLITTVLIILIGMSYLSKRLAANKSLNSAWK